MFTSARDLLDLTATALGQRDPLLAYVTMCCCCCSSCCEHEDS